MSTKLIHDSYSGNESLDIATSPRPSTPSVTTPIQKSRDTASTIVTITGGDPWMGAQGTDAIAEYAASTHPDYLLPLWPLPEVLTSDGPSTSHPTGQNRSTEPPTPGIPESTISETSPSAMPLGPKYPCPYASPHISPSKPCPHRPFRYPKAFLKHLEKDHGMIHTQSSIRVEEARAALLKLENFIGQHSIRA